MHGSNLETVPILGALSPDVAKVRPHLGHRHSGLSTIGPAYSLLTISNSVIAGSGMP